MARRPAVDTKTQPESVISAADLESLSTRALVSRLVSRGVSPLTAERFVEIQRGKAEPGRARTHAVSRR
jgi:hypothetical protein